MSGWAIFGIVIGAIALLAALVSGAWRLSPWGSRRAKLRKLKPPQANNASLALARAAYERDDFIRVCQLLEPEWDTRPIPEQLLYAGACKRLKTVKGDEGSVTVFETIAEELTKGDGSSTVSPAAVVKILLPQERAILGDLLLQRPDVLEKLPDLVPSTSTSKSEPPTGFVY